MRLLIIKTSSLGDIVHTLPALTDALKNNPDLQCDWVVEKSFSEIPHWHPAVKNTITVQLREWRKHPLRVWKNQSWKHFYHQLREKNYDFVIDAQGLIKSGLLAFFSRGICCGYDWRSAWEPLACFAYQRKFAVNPKQHAITRVRQLFAHSLGYAIPTDFPDYGIQSHSFLNPAEKNYCVFLHGTTRNDKCWPEEQWRALIHYFKKTPYQILLPWGNEPEKQRADRLAFDNPNVRVLDKINLNQLAALLKYSTLTIAVDTGLGHLSAALNTPTISLYGPTNPCDIGTIGKNQLHIYKKRMKDISAAEVWNKVEQNLKI